MEDDVLKLKEVVSVTFDTTPFIDRSCKVCLGYVFAPSHP